MGHSGQGTQGPGTGQELGMAGSQEQGLKGRGHLHNAKSSQMRILLLKAELEEPGLPSQGGSRQAGLGNLQKETCRSTDCWRRPASYQATNPDGDCLQFKTESNLGGSLHFVGYANGWGLTHVPQIWMAPLLKAS